MGLFKQALLASALLAPAHGAEAQEGCGTMKQMQWLLGHWRSEVESTVFTENWRKNANGALVGEAKSVSSETGEVHLEESLRLEMRSGVLTYIADVSANHGEVAFSLTGCEGTTILFENPEHDFPKRITYEKIGADEMTARITDLKNEGFELNFQRVGESP